MNFQKKTGKRTGLCFICHKSSKLPIHQNCGGTRPSKKGHDQAKHNYEAGKLPPWMFL